MISGSSTRRLASSGWVARCHSDEPMADHVVSTPAIRVSAAMPMMVRSGIGSPSTSACSSELMRSSPGSVRRSAICCSEEADDAVLAAVAAHGIVRELEHVAHPAGERVGQVAGHAEDLGDDAHRDLLRVVGRRVGSAAFDEPVDEAAAQLAGHRLVLGHAACARTTAAAGAAPRCGSAGRSRWVAAGCRWPAWCRPGGMVSTPTSRELKLATSCATANTSA